MIKVGLTGNIGSGKSTVAKIFEILNIPIFYSDIVAKRLYKNPDVIKRIVDNVSPKVLVNGEINFKMLAEIIFNSKKHLNSVNKIIHPLVSDEFLLWCNNNSESPYVIHESAIIFENNLQKQFDYTIVVTAPEDIRIKRISDRDNTNEENIRKRVANQMDEFEKVKMADYIINNDGTSFLTPVVLSIHQQLLKKAHLM